LRFCPWYVGNPPPARARLLTAYINGWQLPFWALVTFGCSLLSKLGYALLTFNDVPEAHKSLMLEIETARKDLRSKGVDC